MISTSQSPFEQGKCCPWCQDLKSWMWIMLHKYLCLIIFYKTFIQQIFVEHLPLYLPSIRLMTRKFLKMHGFCPQRTLGWWESEAKQVGKDPGVHCFWLHTGSSSSSYSHVTLLEVHGNPETKGRLEPSPPNFPIHRCTFSYTTQP